MLIILIFVIILKCIYIWNYRVVYFKYIRLYLSKRVMFRGQTAETRRTTILQPVERKSHSQKDRQNEKAEGYIPDEGTR